MKGDELLIRCSLQAGQPAMLENGLAPGSAVKFIVLYKLIGK